MKFQCPACSANYEVAKEMAGRSILCRMCGKRGMVSEGTAVTLGASSRVAAGPGATSVAAPPASRYAGLILLTKVVGLLLLGFCAVYYWSRPLPWEVRTPSTELGGRPPGGGGGPPPANPQGNPPPAPTP